MIGFMLEFVNQIVHRRREQEERDIALFDYEEQVMQDLMMDMLDEQEEAYMEEVEHGWDEAWEDHYFGEGP
jgi:hypothetical protein